MQRKVGFEKYKEINWLLRNTKKLKNLKSRLEYKKGVDAIEDSLTLSSIYTN